MREKVKAVVNKVVATIKEHKVCSWVVAITFFVGVLLIGVSCKGLNVVDRAEGVTIVSPVDIM